MEDTIPKSIHMVFQLMFFIITPALIAGAYAERMKFSTMVVFSILWGTFVYCPIAHWVWGPHGWLLEGEFAAFDFAGGTVVHISSGVSALLLSIVLGKRIGYGENPMPPHNLTYTCIGAALLWVGWFGFNAGSALHAECGGRERVCRNAPGRRSRRGRLGRGGMDLSGQTLDARRLFGSGGGIGLHYAGVRCGESAAWDHSRPLRGLDLLFRMRDDQVEIRL